MIDLAILIPSRNEMFLSKTIEDILSNIEGETHVIVILDGQWAYPPIEDDPRVTLVYHSESIGQRAATNEAARIARSMGAKYVMKVDAHCAFDKGFDVKMMNAMQPDWTMVPVMKNLHAFDWVCDAGHRRYQGPSGKKEDDGDPWNGVCTERISKDGEPEKLCGLPAKIDIVWTPKASPNSTSFRFDRDLHFQYWSEYKRHQRGDLVETMSIQGSCFMVTTDKYFELELCDEKHGSWGQQGVEVACKTWLSGGRVICNKNTWYAHMFRTQGGDFGFPYPNPGIGKAREYSRNLWLNNKWEKAKYPLKWLIAKFAPVPDWEDYEKETEAPEKEIIYYTCNTHKEDIELACREQLKKSGVPILSVSLNKEIDFGDTKVLVAGERSSEMMHQQILIGLMKSKAKYVFLCESDVLYHPLHFQFTPTRDDIIYYNVNVWKVRYPDGFAVYTDNLQQVSGICANRELLLDFYTKRVEQIKKEGFNRHFEPGDKQTVDVKYSVENYITKYPNICIRHDANLTKSKWSPEEFRNKEYAKGWTEGYFVKGWGDTKDLMKNIVR